MIKSNDDTKITALPAPESTMPRLDIQTAVNWLSGVQRLNELAALPENTMTRAQSEESSAIRTELGHFVSAHAVQLVQAYLQVASILHPLQQSLSNIIVPAVAKALADRFDNEVKTPEKI